VIEVFGSILFERSPGANVMRFYKYRSVVGDLAEDYALKALFGSYAIFSSRKNFNDLFDSKIDIPYPSPKEVRIVVQDPKAGKSAADVRLWVRRGEFTPQGRQNLDKAKIMLDELFDSYAFLSLSSHDASPLLWAHYASSHTGFCIEFEFPPASQPNEVRYQEHIEEVPLLEFIKSWVGLSGAEFGERIHQALLVKLDYWAYEGEFRWFANNEMGRVPKNAKFLKIPYEPQWVKAIIFGCRTPAHLKVYIRENLPFMTEFKQAIEGKDSIAVVPFDERLHL
jgi:Protein of unknown function (DUF2971)